MHLIERAWLAVVLLSVAFLLAGCCSTASMKAADPNGIGIQAQRTLIQESFAGTDLRSDEDSLAAFRAGARDSVSAAWFEFNKDDATAALQAALDSGARVVLVPAMDSPWITEPLFLRSHTSVVIQEGAEIVAKSGSFKGIDNALISLRDIEDVSIMGYGARLLMRKGDYRKKPYQESQWRHAIELYGCSDVTVLGLAIESSGGDGVYLGRGAQIFDKNVTLRDLILRDNYRQGVSVISVQDLLMENVDIAGTEGTLPSAGIDFEPNNSDERIVGCLIRNCRIRSNAGPGILVVMTAFNESSEEIDIRVRDCIIANPPLSFAVFRASKARGTIDIQNTCAWGLQVVWPGSGVKVVRN